MILLGGNWGVRRTAHPKRKKEGIMPQEWEKEERSGGRGHSSRGLKES